MHVSRLAQLRQAHACLGKRMIYDAQRIGLDLLQRYKEDYEALRLLAEISRQLRDFDAAIGYAQRMIKASPREADGYIMLASYLNQRGRHKEAAENLKKLLKLHPDYP